MRQDGRLPIPKAIAELTALPYVKSDAGVAIRALLNCSGLLDGRSLGSIVVVRTSQQPLLKRLHGGAMGWRLGDLDLVRRYACVWRTT